MKKLASILLAAVMLAAMLSVFAVPASAEEKKITEAYPYPGDHIPEEGYYYIYNAGERGYLGAEMVKVNGKDEVRFHIQENGDLFQVIKKQLSSEKGKEDVYAYKIMVVKSPVARAEHSLRVMGTNGYPEDGTEIDEGADIGLWFQRWAFDDAGNGKVYIRSYLDDDPNQGIAGIHPYLDIKPDTSDKRVCLTAHSEGSKTQLWALERPYKNDKGTGTVNDPYRFSNANELAEFAKMVADYDYLDYAGKYFELTGDITYDGPAIGAENSPFSGVFDGDGHTVNVQISGGSYTGLFPYLNGATVKNLKIEGTVSGTGEGAGVVGGVAGYACKTVIDNCSVAADVSGTDKKIGGIVGEMSEGTISDCRVEGTVSGAGIVGGVAGYACKTVIDNCSVAADVSGTGEKIGGIVGEMSEGTISDCRVEGTVSGGAGIVGGVAGYAYGKTAIDNCSVAADVSGTGANVGGIVGEMSEGTISDCRIEGTVSGTGEGAGSVGGVAGYAYGKTAIDKCYVTADVTGASANVGGIAGLVIDAKISDCRMDGNVKNVGWTSTGGVVGGIIGGGEIVNCVSAGEIVGDKAVGGILGCVMSGETMIGNCSSLGSTAENTAGSGREHGGIVGYIDGGITYFIISNSYTKCDIGVSTGSASIMGNNVGAGRAHAYFVYYVEKGKASGVYGTGSKPASNSRTIQVTSRNDSQTLDDLNLNAENYRDEGYAFSDWTKTGRDTYFPTSCTVIDGELSDAPGVGSVLSQGSLWIIIVAAAVLVLCLIAVLVIVKKKKKKAEN